MELAEYNTAEIKADIQKWIEGLRSGEYRQGHGALQPTPENYCCLGVACKVIIPKHRLLFIPPAITGPLEPRRLEGGTVMSQINAPEWLVSVSRTFARELGEGLTGLNDHHGLSFEQIADILESLFIKGDVEAFRKLLDSYAYAGPKWN